MEAYSTATGTTYVSWDALVEAETNGWCTTIVMMKVAKTGKTRIFSRVLGPHNSKREARNMAARVRREWKRATAANEIEPGLTLLNVGVEPAWKEFH